MLAENEVEIGSLSTRAMYNAVCCEAAAGRMIGFVAAAGDKLAGCILAARNYRRSWMRLLLRHPLLATRVLAVRAIRRLRRPAAAVRSQGKERMMPDLAYRRDSEWNVSRRDIANIMFIGVAPPWRGLGVGTQLYHEFFRYCRAQGITRILAHISPDNIASIHLHRKLGYELSTDGNVVFAGIDLNEPPFEEMNQ